MAEASRSPLEREVGGSVSHEGVVESVTRGVARIRVATGGCSSCGHATGCGIGRLAAGRQATVIQATAPAGLREGQRVSLDIDTGSVTVGAVLGYLAPALAILVGAAAGQAATGMDAGAAAGAALGCCGGLAFIRVLRLALPLPTLRPLESPSRPISFHALESRHD